MAGYIRRVPTDEDSGLMAWFWNGDGVAKNREKLMAVASGDRPFVAVGSRWEKCEVATSIPIPDGFRQCTAEEVLMTPGARRWVSSQDAWLPAFGAIAHGRPEYFIVPVKVSKDKAAVPKYRPFATREEWWPHRDRWVRSGESVFQLSWIGSECAAGKLSAGAVFLNDDGTDAEPFGFLVTEDE